VLSTVKVMSGKVAFFEQSMIASLTTGKKVIPNYLAIALTISVGPTIREVPESTIPWFNPVYDYPSTEIEFKLTGQYVSFKIL